MCTIMFMSTSLHERTIHNFLKVRYFCLNLTRIKISAYTKLHIFSYFSVVALQFYTDIQTNTHIYCMKNLCRSPLRLNNQNWKMCHCCRTFPIWPTTKFFPQTSARPLKPHIHVLLKAFCCQSEHHHVFTSGHVVVLNYRIKGLLLSSFNKGVLI